MNKRQLLIYTSLLGSSPLTPTISGVGKISMGLGFLEFAVVIYWIYQNQNHSIEPVLHEQLKLL